MTATTQTKETTMMKESFNENSRSFIDESMGYERFEVMGVRRNEPGERDCEIDDPNKNGSENDDEQFNGGSGNMHAREGGGRENQRSPGQGGSGGIPNGGQPIPDETNRKDKSSGGGSGGRPSNK